MRLATARIRKEKCEKTEDFSDTVQRAYDQAVSRGNGMNIAIPVLIANCGIGFSGIKDEMQELKTSVIVSVLSTKGGDAGTKAFHIMQEDFPCARKNSLGKCGDSLVNNRKFHRNWVKAMLRSIFLTPVSGDNAATNYVRSLFGATDKLPALQFPLDSPMGMQWAGQPGASLFPAG